MLLASRNRHTYTSRDRRNLRGDACLVAIPGIFLMNVLFIGIDYFGYTQKIMREFKDLGADVTYVDIQPRDFWMNSFRVLFPRWYRRTVDARHARQVEATAGTRYDRVIFLQAHQFALPTLERLKALQPQATFVLYNWDALTTHDYRPQAAYFDEVYTFDARDAAAHGWHYLPLFCPREMQGLARDKAPARSVYTVGNIVNARRYDAIKAFERYCKAHDIRFEAFMRMTPVVYLRFLKAGRIPRGISFRSIAPEAFRAMIERSAATFDFANHQAQSGHTMRTFENLCGGKKVITNNAGVKGESFATPDRFLVYEGHDFDGVAAFLDQPLEDPSADFPQYHIQTFARQLLGRHEQERDTAA
jgi:hypothetical protein